MTSDSRRHSPAAERNRTPILEQLQRLLPAQGHALEIASGSGQHAAHFAAGLPGWRWQPTDAQPDALASIRVWTEGLANVEPPLALDVLVSPWVGVQEAVDAIFCANMLHVSPAPTCAALMQGAARHLSPQGLLLLYGPFIIDGEPVASSNLAFDADLRSRDPAWGLRQLSEVVREAQRAGLDLRERIAMPANNQLLAFDWLR